jgi:hypothetical protein
MSTLTPIVLLSFWLAVYAEAQTCVSPPSDSPILAPTLDTIPPVIDTILTYTGARAEARANAKVAFIEVNENEQRVWFGVDSSPGLGKTYYNRRYRANSSSPWYWQYNHSIKLIDLGNSSALPASVLYSSVAKYRDPLNITGALYKYVMYLVSQPSACDGGILGYMYVSFSDDGICWTPIRRGTVPDGPIAICGPDTGKKDMVPIEVMSAIDGGDTIHLMIMEGDASKLLPHNSMDRTYAHIAYASPAAPTQIQWYGNADVDIVKFGVFSPSGSPSSTRYQTYNYFMNLDMAFDPTNGYLYVARGYPFPFDRWADVYNAQVPCHWQGDPVVLYDPVRNANAGVSGCYMSPYTITNRVQIYRMYLGGIGNFPITAYHSNNYVWQLVADWGGDIGYTIASSYGNCAYAARTDPRQQNVGRDYAYLTFLRDRVGNLVLYNGAPMVLAGDSFKLSKGYGLCHITGTETVTLATFPR